MDSEILVSSRHGVLDVGARQKFGITNLSPISRTGSRPNSTCLVDPRVSRGKIRFMIQALGEDVLIRANLATKPDSISCSHHPLE